MQPTLKPLSDGIYAFSGAMRQTRPWIGVVVTPEGTVLIDSGNGALQIADLRAALDEIAAPPVTHILLTHHHWDHVFGSCYLPGAKVIAHEHTQYHLNVMAEEPWCAEYNRNKAGESPTRRYIAEQMNNAVPDWTTFHAIPAHETFGKSYSLTVGGYTFEMTHVGGVHANDSCVVMVTPGDVLFVGDTLYGSVRGDHDPRDLQRELERLAAFGADWVVEGHRRPRRGSEFQAWVAEQAARSN